MERELLTGGKLIHIMNDVIISSKEINTKI